MRRVTAFILFVLCAFALPILGSCDKDAPKGSGRDFREEAVGKYLGSEGAEMHLESQLPAGFHDSLRFLREDEEIDLEIKLDPNDPKGLILTDVESMTLVMGEESADACTFNLKQSVIPVSDSETRGTLVPKKAFTLDLNGKRSAPYDAIYDKKSKTFELQCQADIYSKVNGQELRYKGTYRIKGKKH